MSNAVHAVQAIQLQYKVCGQCSAGDAEYNVKCEPPPTLFLVRAGSACAADDRLRSCCPWVGVEVGVSSGRRLKLLRLRPWLLGPAEGKGRAMLPDMDWASRVVWMPVNLRCSLSSWQNVGEGGGVTSRRMLVSLSSV